jgi:hypothetical protein
MITLAMVWSACESPQRGHPLAPKVVDTIEMLPTDASVMGYLDAHALRTSEFGSFLYKENLNAIKELEPYRVMQQLLGWDPFEQIDDLYWTLNPETDPEQGFFLLAKGDFDMETLFSSLKINSPDIKLMRQERDGHLFYEIKVQGFQIMVVDKEMMVIGQESDVISWEQAYLGTRQPPSEGPLKSRIAVLNRLQVKSGLWLWLDPTAIELDVSSDVVENVVLGAEFVDRLRMHSKISCKDNEAAETISEALKGMMATLKLSATDDRQIIDLINDIETRVNENEIDLNTELTVKEFQTVMQHRGIEIGKALD